MKKAGILILFQIFIFSFSGFGQCNGVDVGVLTAEDSIRCTGEETLLSLTGSQGNITWLERQFGVTSWSLTGASGTEYTVYPSTKMEYLAIAGNGVPECYDTSSIVEIDVSTISAEPNPWTGFDECGLKFLTGALSSGESIEYWSMVSGPGSVLFYPDQFQPTLDSMVVSEAGVYEIAWNISDGVCTKEAVETYTAKETPVANAGVDSNICGTTYMLNAKYSISGATGTWSKISGGYIEFGDADSEKTSPTPTVTSSPMDYTLSWTETSPEGCPDTDIIEISVASQPMADAGIDADECDLDVQLDGSKNLGFGEWETPASVTFDNSNSEDATATVSDYSESIPFYWTVVNSFCADTDTVIINFYEQPVVSVFSADDACGDSTSLIANKSVDAAIGAWSLVSGSQAPVQLTDTTASAEITADQYGIAQTYRWKEVNGTCSDSTDVSLTFYEQPVADAGIDTGTCDVQIQLNATPSVGSGNWSAESSSVSFVTSNTMANAEIAIGDDYGEYLLKWKETNEICSDSSSVTVTFNEMPTATVSDGGDTCGFEYTLVTTKSVDGSYGEWDDDAYFATSDSANWAAIVESEGIYQFTWKEINGNCMDSTTVSVEFKELPDAEIDLDLSETLICGNEGGLSATPTTGTGLWENISGDGTLAFSSTSESEVQTVVDAYGTYEVTWTVINQDCSASDSVELKFVEVPEANAGEDQVLDNVFETTLNAELPGGMSGEWLLVEGSGDVESVSQYNSNVTGLDYDENIFEWTVSNQGLCSSSDSVSIFVYDIFIPEVITPNGDGDNDVFEIKGLGSVESVEITIFNRWGGEVFHTTDKAEQWDGTNESGVLLTNDTYFYVVDIDNGTDIHKGFVMLSK